MPRQPDLLFRLSAGPVAHAASSPEVRAARAPAAHTTQYRADIDGLHAIAVLGVVLFHARVPAFSGGYVGVDVFFVISGYLITRLLAASNDLSGLKTFYIRRGRRILPVLLVTSAVTAAVAGRE